MELGLSGKTAIITGASQGIGREIARAMHHEGMSVVLVSRTATTLQRAAKAIQSETGGEGAAVHTLVADLSLRAEVEKVVAESLRLLGHVDVLVNNASTAKSGNFFQMSDADMLEAVQVKMLGYVRMVHALGPHMMERRSGSIVNIVGSAARTPTSDFIAGSMGNAALVNFTRGVARELALANVRINSVSPGWTKTDRQSASFAMQAAAKRLSVEEVEQQAARAVPLNRLVGTDEVCRLVLALASDLLPSMTGEDIIIDGGATPSI